jgi:hypothetical protein
MTDLEYEEGICQIPHLNLTKFLPPVPVGSILREFSANRHHIRKFEYSREVDQQHADYLGETWQGFSLVDITQSGEHMIDYYTADITHPRVKELGAELGDDGYAKFRITDIGLQMPVTTQYTTGLFKNLCRVRISKVTKGHTINYHCHLAKAKRNPSKIVPDNSYRATIHIPLITNKQCFFSVTKDIGFEGHPDDFRIVGEPEFHQYYGTGEVWLFNSVHYHRAVNLGAFDRTHLLIYFDFMDAGIRPAIEAAMASYTGPRIT